MEENCSGARVDDFHSISLVAVPYIMSRQCAALYSVGWYTLWKKDLDSWWLKSKGDSGREEVVETADDIDVARTDQGSVKKEDVCQLYRLQARDRVDREKLWVCLAGMRTRGRVSTFLKAVYTNLSCEVKVGVELSDSFAVSCGSRQGCILTPLHVVLVHQLAGN